MYPRQFTHLDGHNAYDVLGVGSAATRPQIEAARRRLAGRVHPDLPTGDAAKMSLVNAAAAILLDDVQRDAYDEYLATEARAKPRPMPRTEPRPMPRTEPRPMPRTEPRPMPRPEPPPLRRPPATGGQAPPIGRPQPRPRPAHRYGEYASASWGAESRGPRASDVREPRWSAAAGRTRVSWADDLDEPGGVRPPLRWQPPPPGPIARWRAAKRLARQAERGEQAGKQRSPFVVLGLLAIMVAACALSGALLGYRANFGGGPKPAPAVTSTGHPSPAPSTHHK
jgi:curved DNA-binding protein CbpA